MKYATIKTEIEWNERHSAFAQRVYACLANLKFCGCEVSSAKFYRSLKENSVTGNLMLTPYKGEWISERTVIDIAESLGNVGIYIIDRINDGYKQYMLLSLAFPEIEFRDLDEFLQKKGDAVRFAVENIEAQQKWICKPQANKQATSSKPRIRPFRKVPDDVKIFIAKAGLECKNRKLSLARELKNPQAFAKKHKLECTPETANGVLRWATAVQPVNVRNKSRMWRRKFNIEKGGNNGK